MSNTDENAGLKQTRRKVNRAVTLLTDPNPQYVSLVGHGANQTPFKVVKEDGQEPEVVVAGVRKNDTTSNVINPTYEGEDMAGKASSKKKLVVKGDEPKATLVKLVFKSASFADEAAVRTYLTQKGYEGGEIEPVNGGGFQVVAKGDDEVTGVKAIEDTEDGVTRYVGELVVKGDDGVGSGSGEAAAVVEPAAGQADAGAGEQTTVTKSEGTFLPAVNQELAKKYDDWKSQYSTAGTVTEVIQAGLVNSPLPIGLWDLTSAMYIALKNRLDANDVAGVRQVTAEYGELIIGLVNLFGANGASLVAKAMLEPAAMLNENQEVVTKSDTPTQPTADAVVLSEAGFTDLVKRLEAVFAPASALQEMTQKAEQATTALSSADESAKTNTNTVATLIEEVKVLKAEVDKFTALPFASRTLDHEIESTPVKKADEFDRRMNANTLGLSIK